MRPPESRRPKLPLEHPVIAARFREKLLGSGQPGSRAELRRDSLKEGELVEVSQQDRLTTQAKHPGGGEVGQWLLLELCAIPVKPQPSQAAELVSSSLARVDPLELAVCEEGQVAASCFTEVVEGGGDDAIARGVRSENRRGPLYLHQEKRNHLLSLQPCELCADLGRAGVRPAAENCVAAGKPGRTQPGKTLIAFLRPSLSTEELYIVTQEKKRFPRARPWIGTRLVKRCWFKVINGYHGCHILEDEAPCIQFIMKKILVIGAHPDDCDIFAGGCAALWKKRGDEVSFISMTNGNAGHHQSDPEELERRRRREAAGAGEVLGVDYEILDNDDGRLLATLENREDLIRRIRKMAPDLVLTHRPNDYHPDHRYTATLVQDAAYMVTVPLICPDTPHLEANPVIAYLFDEFTRPAPMRADVVVDIDSVAEVKWKALHCHESQFYEWLAYNMRPGENSVPDEAGQRLDWLKSTWSEFLERPGRAFRQQLCDTYGEERGGKVVFAEAFEICEFGNQPTREELRELFPVE